VPIKQQVFGEFQPPSEDYKGTPGSVKKQHSVPMRASMTMGENSQNPIMSIQHVGNYLPNISAMNV
jgi:hypothetical protein